MGKRWRKRNKIFQSRMWAVPWRTRDIRIRTVMIQFIETGDILLLPSPPNKMPCVMNRDPAQCVYHTLQNR